MCICEGKELPTSLNDNVYKDIVCCLGDNDCLYIIDRQNKREYEFDIQFCPMCGRKLDALNAQLMP